MNVIVEKSFRFSIRIVNLYKYLCATQKEFVMSKQLLHSGTSIGANIAESQQAQSRADFAAKVNISLKEATETKYWLDLLYSTGYMNKRQYQSIYADCCELEKILVSIVKTIKNN